MAPQSVISTTLQLLRDKLVDNSFLAHPSSAPSRSTATS